MIAVAGHLANAGIAPKTLTLPAVAGLDLDATVDRVVGWGGDPALYGYFLGRALVEAPERDAATARSIAVVAGWRAGVVALRQEALGTLARLDPATGAAAVGLTAEQLAEFLEVQARDAFWAPGQFGAIARIGGFRGFGGPWTAPPTSAHLAGNGVVAIACGDELWIAHADVFGCRLDRVDTLPEPVADAAWPVAEVSPMSYLVSVVRP